MRVWQILKKGMPFLLGLALLATTFLTLSHWTHPQPPEIGLTRTTPTEMVVNSTTETAASCRRQCTAGCPQEPSAGPNCPPKLTRVVSQGRNCSDGERFERLMEDRRRVLLERCQARMAAGQISLSAVAKEKFYLRKVGEKGILWCPVFKAASSSTNFHFCPLYYQNCDKYSAAIWRSKLAFNWQLAPKHTTKLLIVRHPFERLFSAYRDKIQAPRHGNGFIGSAMRNAAYNQRIIPPELTKKKSYLLSSAIKIAAKQMQDHPVERGQYVYMNETGNPYLKPLSATFEEFVRAVVMGQFEDVHWKQVENYCAPCGENYDFILKVEDYKCEFSQFLTTINSSQDLIDGVDATKAKNANTGRSEADRSDFYDYFAELPDKLLDALYEWYKVDCELFDYDCQETLCEIREWRIRKSKES